MADSQYIHFDNQREINDIESLINHRRDNGFAYRLFNGGKPVSAYMKYPIDLLSDPIHQCIMRINVHEAQDSKLKTKREAFTKFATTVANSINGSINDAQNPNKPQEEKTGFAQVAENAASAIGGTLDVLIGGLFDAAAAGDLRGQGLGFNSYTEEQTGIVTTDPMPVASIYLYMPTGLESKYQMEYEDQSMAAMDILKLPKALAEGADSEVARDIGKKIGLANLKLLDKVGELVGADSGTFAKYISAQTRQVVNPMTLHLFKEVKRREFSFSYTFLFRNREELLTCYKIINTLKYYSHPKRSEGSGRFLDYPAEFTIDFILPDGRVNHYLPYIHKCVLTNVSVKYGEDTVMSTFDSTNDPFGAAPTKVTLELTFSELEILTRERFGTDILSS
jgi:hypothetical protein